MTEEISVRNHVSQSRLWWSLYVSETINVVHRDSQVFCAARGRAFANPELLTRTQFRIRI